jgi:hypothetical protein
MSPSRLVRALLACFFVPLFASVSWAQLPPNSSTTSTPVPGAGHDYLGGVNETVNPANGSVSIRIPVIMAGGPESGPVLSGFFMATRDHGYPSS